MEKNNLNEVYDFKKVPVPEKLLEIKVPNIRIDEILQNARERFLTIEQVYDGIIKGDFAVIEMDDSSEEDGKKRIQINVGKNIFNKQFELDLIGMKKDDVKNIGLNNKAVNVKIISVKRRMIPPLTDEIVKRLNIEGVTSEETYRKYLFDGIAEQIKDQKSQALVDYVIKQVISKTEFPGLNDDSEGVKAYCDYYTARINIIAQSKGISFDEALIASLGKENLEKSQKALRDIYMKDTKSYYIGRYFAEENNVEFTEKNSEQKLRQMAEQSEIPYEELLKQMPVNIDVMNSYKEYYDSIINDCYEDKFKVALV